MNKILSALFTVFFISGVIAVHAQKAKADLVIDAKYFNSNNTELSIKANTKVKIKGKFQTVPGIDLSFYITEENQSNLLGKAKTNEQGNATVFLTDKAAAEWKKSAKQNFIVVSVATPEFESANATVEISKGRLQIDTADGKIINVKFEELKDSVWTVVKDVELKVAVKRLDGDLNVNETQTYTTDSLGAVSAEFKRDSLPGDSKNNLVLIAKIEDNDLYGNLSVEKQVPWGIYQKWNSHFDARTLFARRGRAPVWLEIMAFSIAFSVWVVLIYLLFQIRKMKQIQV